MTSKYQNPKLLDSEVITIRMKFTDNEITQLEALARDAYVLLEPREDDYAEEWRDRWAALFEGNKHLDKNL